MKKKVIVLVAIIVSIIVGIIIFSNNSNNLSWNYKYMEYSKLHEYSTGKGQVIALIDSGISDFQRKSIENTISVINEDTEDRNGHGTIMASIIKGDEDVLGISPDSEIISIKILDEDEKISADSIAKALRIAIDSNVNIINISIGSYKEDKKVEELIKEAINKKIIVVASSGDYKDTKMMFPANVENVISVGAIGENKNVLDITSGSEDTTINAPGENILGLSIQKNKIYSSGTSQATALITGYIALLLDYTNNNISSKEIENYLKSIKNKKNSYLSIFKEIDIKEN